MVKLFTFVYLLALTFMHFLSLNITSGQGSLINQMTCLLQETNTESAHFWCLDGST